MKRLDIIFEDSSCVVINKPAGLAVQGGKGVGLCLDNILAQKWERRPFLVHRLDKDTSGLILVAKTSDAARRFSHLMGGFLIKRYRAVCKGKPARAEVVIKADIKIRGSIKKALTRCRLLSGTEEFSLLELELGTGRMHQIRRHLAMAGNPVLGDDKYGDFNLNHKLRTTHKLRHLLLHASQIIIPETPDNARLDISAPLPDYFQQFLAP
ncbi:MAG: RluA family pseudouridine synthase [Treponema sp.]|nr:RluA family pseudouridine synthase [Treponema sp.]